MGRIRDNLPKEVFYQNCVEFEHVNIVRKDIQDGRNIVQSCLESLIWTLLRNSVWLLFAKPKYHFSGNDSPVCFWGRGRLLKIFYSLLTLIWGTRDSRASYLKQITLFPQSPIHFLGNKVFIPVKNWGQSKGNDQSDFTVLYF